LYVIYEGQVYLGNQQALRICILY